MLSRYYHSIDGLMPQNKVLIIYGSRRAEKTTLLNQLLKSTRLKYKIDSGENIKIHEILSSGNFDLLGEYVEGYNLVADEAQEIEKIGKGPKILINHFPNTKLIATGSSSFDLSQRVGEPLTGKKRIVTPYPFSRGELLNHFTAFELKNRLSDYLIFGSYPEVIISESKQEKTEILDELVGSYLLKDILSLENIRNPKTLFNLLKLLSFQVGNLVSVNELSKQLHVDGKTVNRYPDLLEKTFTIFKIRAFSGNLRKEISKKNKYYFFDNGIRNGIIMQLAPFNLRNDIDQLWENFMVSEFYKKNSYLKPFYQLYFWRNYNEQKIDLLFEKNGEFTAFEFKWEKEKAKLPPDFVKKYGAIKYTAINRFNYLDYLQLT